MAAVSEPRALLLVDLQNDYCPGGALAVPGGDEVVPVANRLAARADLVLATQDWHPANHGAFAASHPGRRPYDLALLAGLPQMLWPVHCVQGSLGAALHGGLEAWRIARVFHRGSDATLDGHSGFFDNARRAATGLAYYLRERGVNDLIIVGLATDTCVRATVLDAAALGFAVTVVEDGCRGVELRAGDIGAAFHDMRRAGARIVGSDAALR